MRKTCDIIIPAYNCRSQLARTLKALRAQHIPNGWRVRVVVCDDGSSDNTGQVVQRTSWPAPWRVPLVSRGKHAGIAAARNRGIRESDSTLLLFLGADIILRQHALAEHIRAHEHDQSPTLGALGMIAWDPIISPSPFMEWMIHGGQHNDYDAILGKKYTHPDTHFYGSNVSIKKAALGSSLFSKSYQQYGWEDLDLGVLLRQRGLVLRVLHGAKGVHHHFYAPSAILSRQYRVGAGYVTFTKRNPHADHPRLTPIRSAKVLVYRILGARTIMRALVGLLGNVYATPRLYWLVTTAEFWCGVQDARRKRTHTHPDSG